MKRVRRLFGKGQAGADEAQGEGEIVATGDVAHRSEGEAVPAEFARPRSRADIMQDVAAAGFMREDFDAIGHLLVRAAVGGAVRWGRDAAGRVVRQIAPPPRAQRPPPPRGCGPLTLASLMLAGFPAEPAPGHRQRGGARDVARNAMRRD